MKTIITLFTFIILFSSTSFAQSEKTFVKTLASVDSELSFDFPGEVEIKKWDSDYIKVSLSISSENASDEMLKRLVEMGRYDFSNIRTSGKLVVGMPKISKKVFISGEELFENFKIEIFVPHNVKATLTGNKTNI